MRRFTCTAALLCLGLASATAWGQAPLTVIDHIPGDVRGFAVLRNIDSTMKKVDALATRFELPVPSLDSILGEFDEGLDRKRNVGVAWLDQREGDDEMQAYRHFVIYLPVTDYKAFVGQFDPADADAEISAIAVGGQEFVLAQKADFAIVAEVRDQASLEHVLRSKTSISVTSKPLHEWVNENDLTVSVTPSGTKLMFAKLKEGLAFVKNTAMAGAGENSQMIESALGMYESMFDAGEKEFTQFAIGLRIDPDSNIAIHKRALLAKDGWLANVSQKLEAPNTPVAGLPAGPFLMAFEGAMPGEWSKQWMEMSFNMLRTMQGPDGGAITEEQVEKLSESAANAMKGIRSMAFCMGVGEAGLGFYDKASGIMRVDDADAFIDRYGKAFAKMNEAMAGTSLEGAYQVESLNQDGVAGLHLVMDMSKFQFGGVESADALPPQFEQMFGKDGKLSVYLAKADEKTVVMAYISPDNLKRALDTVQSKTDDLADDNHVQATTKMLSDSAQWVGYISLSGTMQFAGNMMRTMVPDAEWPFAELPASAPLGFSIELTPQYLDAQFVVPLETIDVIKAFAMEMQQ